MDPQYEQRLRDEVIYLHSLWHQGPPRPAAAAAAAATTTTTFPAARRHLPPANETQFKRVKKGSGKKKKKTTNNSNTAVAEPISSPGIEWKCPTPPPPASTTSWPNWVAKPNPNPHPVSAEDQLLSTARHAHHHAIKVVHEFLRCNKNNDGDDSDAIDSSSDDDDGDNDSMDEDCGREEYSFFFKMFKEDTELREYYEKNFAKGEFSCLVCGAIGGKKMGKKYTGCLPLVQHSITIAKTKKRRTHRAFALAVCKVLNWDIDQLHTIVSLLSDKSGENEGNGNIDKKESSILVKNVDSVDDDTVEGKSDNLVQESEPVVTGILSNSDDGLMNSLACPSSEWECPTTPPPASTSGWPSLVAKSDPKPLPLSSDDQLKLAARHAHQHAIKVVHEFFRCNNNNDDGDSDAIDSSSDEDEDDSMDEDCERNEYSFFFKVFKEDAELREYYEKNFAKGDFSCLVCGAVGGKKMGKKYVGCLALVQHSITIAKTKKKRAHRAFALAVCKVLSWDIDQLPTIVSLLSDKSGETEASGNDNKESLTTINNVDSVEDDTVEGKSDNVVQESEPVVTGKLSNGDGENTNSLACPDASKNLEHIDMIHPHKEENPTAEDLASNSMQLPDVDNNLENRGMVCPDNVEAPASVGLAINSLTFPDAEKNLDSCEYPHKLEEPTSEGLVAVPLPENITVGNEMQDLQNGNAILTELNKGDEN